MCILCSISEMLDIGPLDKVFSYLFLNYAFVGNQELIGIKSISLSPRDECFNTVIISIMLHTQDAFCTLYKVTFLNEIVNQDKRLNILKGCFSF